MIGVADIGWFKSNFGTEIATAVAGSLFDVDRLTALACQETGELWRVMRTKPGLTPTQIAALCCGDTLDADKGRKAFPKTKEDLIAEPNGQEMFDIARQALLAMAGHVPGYEFAFTNARKFCHGFGMFQYDLQYFLTNPDYFLDRDYEIFGRSLHRALGELDEGLKTLGLQDRSSITDLEFCHVAICYNTGSFKADKGLQQGHRSGGKYYGELIRDFLTLSRTVEVPELDSADDAAAGPSFRVNVTSGSLRLRREPRISTPVDANVETMIADGWIVRSFTGARVNGFIEIETVIGGRLFRGFASASFLVPLAD